jgi:tetratricopeptide (TPR) repeat protein
MFQEATAHTVIWVRIPVPSLLVVSMAAIVASLFALSHYGCTSLHHLVGVHNHAPNGDLQTSTDPQVLLAEADRFYWLNNGPKAGPLYDRAESLFANRGDARNALYAKIGRLRSQAETMSFVELSRFLNEQLQNPVVRSDPKLHLWCLIAKGYSDIEIDYRASKRDWMEASEIAKSLGEDQWANRASGELGLIDFLEGNPGRAARMLGGSLLTTMANGDKGGQIRFLELLGNGFEEVKRHTEALKFFERAITLAKSDGDIGIPFMAYEGKAQALAALGSTDEAKRVLQGRLQSTVVGPRSDHAQEGLGASILTSIESSQITHCPRWEANGRLRWLQAREQELLPARCVHACTSLRLFMIDTWRITFLSTGSAD